MPVPSAPRTGEDYSGFPESTIRRQLHKQTGCSHSLGLPLKNQRREVSQILSHLGPRTLRRMAQDSQSLSRPDKVSKTLRSHLLHDVTAMNLDGFFGRAQLIGDLFVEHTRYDMSHHFTFPYRERVITLA